MTLKKGVVNLNPDKFGGVAFDNWLLGGERKTPQRTRRKLQLAGAIALQTAWHVCRTLVKSWRTDEAIN